MGTKNKKIAIGISVLALLTYWNRSIIMYGLVNKEQLDRIILDVTDKLGNGKNNTAHLLLSETAQQETHYGDFPDTTKNSGFGVMQFDQIGILDVQQRTPRSIKDQVMEYWGVDIDRVTGMSMQWSPLVSVIMARLKYRLIPYEIPTDRYGRANYWKKWYNSELGAGSPEEYMHNTNIPRFKVT